MTEITTQTTTVSVPASGDEAAQTLLADLPGDLVFYPGDTHVGIVGGRDAIRAAVVELEKAGYVQRRQTTDKTGKFSVNEYVIRECPVSQNPPLEGPSLAQPLSEDPTTGDPATCETLTDFSTQLKKELQVQVAILIKH